MLVGDTSDNVPGVEKVGPKTAVKWLEQYGSLDNIVANAEHVTGKVGENLRAALDWLPTARELITIRCDVGIREHFDELVQQAPDKEKLAELFDRFEFRSWKRELEANNIGNAAKTSSPAPALQPNTHAGSRASVSTISNDLFASNYQPNTSRNFETILSNAQLDAWLAKLNAAPLICFDTETTSLDPMTAKIVGMSFSVEAGSAAYLPLKHDYFDAPEQLNFAETLAK